MRNLEKPKTEDISPRREKRHEWSGEKPRLGIG